MNVCVCLERGLETSARSHHLSSDYFHTKGLQTCSPALKSVGLHVWISQACGNVHASTREIAKGGVTPCERRETGGDAYAQMKHQMMDTYTIKVRDYRTSGRLDLWPIFYLRFIEKVSLSVILKTRLKRITLLLLVRML